MRLVLYDDTYKAQLEELLLKFSTEVFGTGTADVDSFVKNHWCIYLGIIDNEVVGFSSYLINYYFGLRTPTLGNSYIYVLEEHRSSKTMYLFSLQSGQICIDNGFDLEHYYSSEESMKLSRKLNGQKIYETYIYELSEVERVFSRLKQTIRKKNEIKRVN